MTIAIGKFLDNQKNAIGLGALFVLLFALLAYFMVQAGPGPNGQEIQGVVARSEQMGWVKLSGRQLNCDAQAPEPYSTFCSISLRGNNLSIVAIQHSPDEPWLDDGECQAFLGDKPLNCFFGSPVIGVHGYAYIDMPDDLTARDGDLLRQRYFIENRPEPFFLGIAIVFGIGTAVFGAWNMWFLLKKRHISVRLMGMIVSCVPLFLGSVWLLIPLIFQFVD